MTIKEMEQLTGLTRANIRFYESEGLLHPQRQDNGYRSYTPEDAEILRRVKLLRSLHMPLTEILSLYRGEAQLIPAMDRQIRVLQAEREQIEGAIVVCREIRSDGGEFGTLDAQRYLDALHIPREQTAQVLTQDVIRPPECPWRRFFARSFDTMLYSTIWYLILLAFRVNLAQRDALMRLCDAAVVFLEFLILEPAMLHLFGTTPGKWLLGLYVRDKAGEKLETADARV